MISCENRCPALQFCRQEEARYRENAAINDRQAAAFEVQELTMRQFSIEADHAFINGQMDGNVHHMIKNLANFVLENNAAPEVTQTADRAAFWRQQAAETIIKADTIQAECRGISKLVAHGTQLLGRSVCGSLAPASESATLQWREGYGHLSSDA